MGQPRVGHLQRDPVDAAELVSSPPDLGRDGRGSPRKNAPSGRAVASKCGAVGWREAALPRDRAVNICVPAGVDSVGRLSGGLADEAEARAGRPASWSRGSGRPRRRPRGRGRRAARTARLAADDRDHQRQAEEARRGRTTRRPADADPDRQRVLHRPRVDALAGERRPVLARPGDLGSCRGSAEQQVELLGEQRVVVGEVAGRTAGTPR